MRKLLLTFLTFFIFLLSYLVSSAQAENPGAYIAQFYKVEQAVAQKYLAYMSAASHGKGIRTANSKRNDLLRTINETIVRVNEFPPYQADTALKSASLDYMRIMYNVMGEDYGKIVNMEEIAEQSYDLMEAYMIAQEKANQKLQEAGETKEQAVKKFASNHKVNLIEQKDGLWQKMEIIGKVTDYYNPIYLIFFKASKQESYLTEAIDKKNINGIEQNKNALLKYSEEGLVALDTMKGFQSDKSLVIACKKTLEFFKLEAGSKLNVVSDHFIKAEEFDKLKKTVNSKSSKEEINTYNKAVNDINKSSKDFNLTIQSLNDRRSEVFTNWNSSVDQFFDTHMPYAAG
jgi:hypothetical protein